MRNITSINDCISREEKKRRAGVAFVNGFIWLILIVLLIIYWPLLIYILLFWGISALMSEYNVRKVQAMGTAANLAQFPEIYEGLKSVCEQFGVAELPRVILLNVSEINALAVKFARKKVIILFSKTLEGVVDKPAEIKFFLGHEIAHILLDHGFRGKFEIYKTAAYHAAREMTCDNCGLAAAENLEAAISAMKRLTIGNDLIKKINVDYMIEEAKHLYSGFTGWLLKSKLRYPPFGKRIANLKAFYESN